MIINTQSDKQKKQNLLFIKIRQKNKMKLFLKSDFISCGEGVGDGSTNYKNYVTDAIGDKINYD